MASQFNLGKHSRAIITRPVNRWSMENVALRPIGSHELLIQVVATGICHTDLKIARLSSGSRILGHEGAGNVCAIGSNVKSASIGDRVILSFAYCKACRPCKNGHPAYCDDIKNENFTNVPEVFSASGESIGGLFFGQSSLSNFTIAKETCITNVSGLVSDDAELALFAPMACGLQTGSGTVTRLADAGDTDYICVMGLGGVGLAAIMAARVRKCPIIIGIDRLADRLLLARELGATHTIDSSNAIEGYLSDEIKRITHRQGTTITIDTTAHMPIIQQALHFTANLGKLILVASPEGDGKFELHIPSFVVTGIQIMGSIEGDAEPQKNIPQMIQWYRDGMFPIDKLIRTFPAENFKEAISLMLDGTVVKPVLLWQ